MLCLTLTGNTLEKNTEYIELYHTMSDLCELRIDLLEQMNLQDIIAFSQQAQLPLILTCRRERDGGAYRRTDRTRTGQLNRLLREGTWAYVDLEEDFRRGELEQIARERNIRIIRSFHDMQRVPADLFSRIERIAAKGEIPKAAVTALNIRDALTLFSAEQQLAHIEKKIILAMGDYGVPTRILYRRTGSLLTYASPPGTSAAPGHLDIESMKHIYRSDQVNSQTNIYGIIGNPVLHTASPRIHNPAFHKVGINAIYVPFLVDDVRTFFTFADRLSVKGFSVTVPHKQQVLPYLGRITREVKQIGSCNTVVWEREYWKGINTDYYGFLRPILNLLDGERIKRAAVIGAGGAARAVVWALRNHQCSVVILNRTPQRAEELARQTGSSWAALDDTASISQVDLIVQTTSVGMAPDTDADPLPGYTFRGDEVVYELIYTPEMTAFMKRAKLSGCSLVPGKQMLLGQGIMQFETFTGLNYPFTEDTVVF